METVKFNDLRSQWEIIKGEAHPRMMSLMENCPFILGPDVKKFEDNFAGWNGNTFCIGVSNGTTALQVATEAFGFSRHVHIYTNANTYIATVLGPEKALNGNCTIHLIDHDEYFQMDTGKLGEALDETHESNPDDAHLIIPVHLYGHSCDMVTIMQLASVYTANVLEDCSQAHGAKCNGKNVGTFGDIAAFSCYPGKNLGAAGDAGLITTDSPELQHRCREIRNMGSVEKYIHNVKGGNYRLDTMQAIILDEKLKHLSDWNEARRHWAKFYRMIDNPNVSAPLVETATWCDEQVYHIFPLLITGGSRNDFMEYMEIANNIQVGIHYPICISETGAYKNSDNVVVHSTEKTLLKQHELVSLPIHPFMTDVDLLRTVETINKWQ